MTNNAEKDALAWHESNVPDSLGDALANIEWATTEMLRALDEGRYQFDAVHVRADLNYLRGEARRACRPVSGVELHCDDCQQPYGVWFAENDVWNLVMGGPDAKGDPGGMLCPRCFTVRAEMVYQQTAIWRLTLDNPGVMHANESPDRDGGCTVCDECDGDEGHAGPHDCTCPTTPVRTNP